MHRPSISVGHLLGVWLIYSIIQVIPAKCVVFICKCLFQRVGIFSFKMPVFSEINLGGRHNYCIKFLRIKHINVLKTWIWRCVVRKRSGRCERSPHPRQVRRAALHTVSYCVNSHSLRLLSYYDLQRRILLLGSIWLFKELGLLSVRRSKLFYIRLNTIKFQFH